MAITTTTSKQKNTATGIRYGGTSLDGTQVLTYHEDGKTWFSKRTLNPENLAAMLAGCYHITRPEGKEVLKPRTEIKAEYKCVDLTTAESLQDPNVLAAIDILRAEGSDVSAIEAQAAALGVTIATVTTA